MSIIRIGACGQYAEESERATNDSHLSLEWTQGRSQMTLVNFSAFPLSFYLRCTWMGGAEKLRANENWSREVAVLNVVFYRGRGAGDATPSRQIKYSWTWSDGLRIRSLCGALRSAHSPLPATRCMITWRRSGVLSSRSAPALHTYRHFWHFLSLSNSSCLINEITAPRNSPPWWFAFQSVSLKTINNIRTARDWHSVFLPRRFLLPQLNTFSQMTNP